jgi:hypothetical protein
MPIPGRQVLTAVAGNPPLRSELSSSSSDSTLLSIATTPRKRKAQLDKEASIFQYNTEDRFYKWLKLDQRQLETSLSDLIVD